MPKTIKIDSILLEYFETLLNFFGPQFWWPGETPFEVIIGAILTQNTAWTNVEKAISNLKEQNLLFPDKLYTISTEKIAVLIKPSGYYNQKAKKITSFMTYFNEKYRLDINNMKSETTETLRNQLLDIFGIGAETADSILLYALSRPVFVVDAYTRRIFSRHNILDKNNSYENIRAFFETHLEKNINLYSEYHALIVSLGKDYCKPTPKCENCPLKKFL